MAGIKLPAALAGIADLYGLVWKCARGNRIRYCTAITLQVLGFLCSLAPPLLLGLAVNTAQDSDGKDIAGIVFWLSMILGSILLSWMLNGPGRVMERQVAVTVRRRLVDRLVGNALDVDIRWHEGRHSGDTTHRIRSTVEAVTSFCESQVFYVKSICTFVGGTTALIVLSRPVGLAALLGFLALGWVVVSIDRDLRTMLDTHVGTLARLSGALADTLANITTVKTLGAGPTSRNHIREVLRDVSTAGQRIIVPMERKWWLITYGSGVLNALLLIGFAENDWHTRGSVRVGFLVTISGYTMALLNTVEVMGGHWQSLLQFQADARSADELRSSTARSRKTGLLPADWTCLTIEALELRHPPREGAATGARVTASGLVLRRGQRIALVGASGSGKSSLLRALAGIYQNEQFVLEVDGSPAPRAQSLTGITGLITQETEVFADTIRNNIDLGTGAGDSRIRRAAENARLTAVIASLPAGLDTNLAERGVDLSGGQRQRVGLARGLLMTEACSLLLFDEPTSSLDPVTEAEIVRNILAARPDATIVAAVHRLNLLCHFDTVVFMHVGAVTDVGGCLELAARQPEFQAMLDSANESVLTPGGTR